MAAWNSSSSFFQRSASMMIPRSIEAVLLCFRFPLLDRIALIDPITGEIRGDHEGPDSCEPHLFQQFNRGFQIGALFERTAAAIEHHVTIARQGFGGSLDEIDTLASRGRSR